MLSLAAKTAAFTLHTNPPRPLVGEATAVRQAAAAAVAGKAGNKTAIARLAGVKDPDVVDPTEPGSPQEHGPDRSTAP